MTAKSRNRRHNRVKLRRALNASHEPIGKHSLRWANIAGHGSGFRRQRFLATQGDDR